MAEMRYPLTANSLGSVDIRWLRLELGSACRFRTGVPWTLLEISQNCFFQLRRMRSIRCSISRKAMLTLAHAFICNRVDCNSLFFGVSSYLVEVIHWWLQSIMNATLLDWSWTFQSLDTSRTKFVRTFTGCRSGSATRSAISFVIVWPVHLPSIWVRFVNTHQFSFRLSTPSVCTTSKQPSGASRKDTVNYGDRGFSVCGCKLWNTLPICRFVNFMKNRSISIKNSKHF